jgi:hypothetical protein
MDIQHTLQECRIDSILESIGIQSLSAKDLFKGQASRWTTNLKTLVARSEGWKTLKSRASEGWVSHLPKLLENEQILREMDPETASESQKEDWSQIFFTGDFSSFNFIPFALLYVAASKIILAPLIAWCMPLVTIFLPYLLLRFVYNLPIGWNDYWAMMKPMLFGGGGLGAFRGPNQGGQEQPTISISTILQWGSMIFSYAHGMYIPYTSAKHCYKIDQLILKGSRAVVDTIQRLREISDVWCSFGLRKPWSFKDPSSLGSGREVIAWILQDKTLLPDLYRAIGRVEITAALQGEQSLVPVQWAPSATPFCEMVDAVDPLLVKEKRVPFTLRMSPSQHHAICTGPNRGGKSTFLRSALTNLVFAHSWGVAFASQCILTPVEWVISSLRLEDRPGEQSLFEREVSVAGEILKRARTKGTRGWVIIDELFHTTNPPDAATASDIFLQQLWSSSQVTSIVSTHLFSHAEVAPQSVQKLCVDSLMNPVTHKITYKYTVSKGMNTMSSVKELLIESGVTLPLNAASRESKTSESSVEKDE